MRLFIALDLPEPVRDYLFKLESELNTGIAKVRWVKKKNIHITLKFLGEVNESQLPEIKKKLEAINFETQELELTSLGFFPNSAKMRVIWIGVEPEKPIIQIQQNIDGAFLSQFPQEQEFKAHLTIGRVVAIKKPEIYLKHLRSVKIKQMNFIADTITLYKSDQAASGREYTPLWSFTAKK